jgi:hypothetical protein
MNHPGGFCTKCTFCGKIPALDDRSPAYRCLLRPFGARRDRSGGGFAEDRNDIDTVVSNLPIAIAGEFWYNR